jgi:transposase
MCWVIGVLDDSCRKHILPSSTVYCYFEKWRNGGSWKQIHDPSVQSVRVAENRDFNLSARVSIPKVPAAMFHEAIGLDPGKQIKNVNALVDNLGLLMAAWIAAVNVPEHEGNQLLHQVQTPTSAALAPHLGQ